MTYNILFFPWNIEGVWWEAHVSWTKGMIGSLRRVIRSDLHLERYSVK